MTDNNLITPPRNLVAQWIAEGNRQEYYTTDEYLIDKVAQWGYEQRGAVNEAELQKARDEEREACCEWVAYKLFPKGPSLQWADDLRAARLLKPKSQAEEALETLHSMRIAPVVINGINVNADVMNKHELIRAALEHLRELEKQADD